jgi:hypothetical protein
MPNLNSTQVFTSLKVVSTDASGDLQETVNVPSSKSSGSIYTNQPISLEAVNEGVAGDLISVQVQDNQGGSNNVAVTGNAIVVNFAETFASAGTATSDSVNIGGGLFSAVVAGANSNIQISIVDSSGAGNDAVSVNPSDNDIGIVLDLDIANYTTQDIVDLISNDASASAAVSASANGNGGNPAESGIFSLVGGADASAQTATKTDVVDLINGNAQSSALVVATGGGTEVPSNQAPVNLSAGADGTVGTLDPSSEYILIKRSDIHSMETTEVNDGRKLIWGVLESFNQTIEALDSTNKPVNLTIAKGNPSLNTSNGVKIQQNYTLQALYGGNELDLASE